MLTFLTLVGMLADTPEALKERVGHDYNNQLSFIEGMRAVVGHDPDFNPRFVDKRGKDGKFTEHSKAKVTVPRCQGFRVKVVVSPKKNTQGQTATVTKKGM